MYIGNIAGLSRRHMYGTKQYFYNNCFGYYLQMYIGNIAGLSRRHMYGTKQYLVGLLYRLNSLEFLSNLTLTYAQFILVLFFIFINIYWVFVH